MFRRFPMGDDITLEFRMEAFNLTNHPQFGAGDNAFVSTEVGDTRFLEIDEGINERVIHFGLKLTFSGRSPVSSARGTLTALHASKPDGKPYWAARLKAASMVFKLTHAFDQKPLST